MNELAFFHKAEEFAVELRRLHQARRAGKTKQKRTPLSRSARQQILAKTGSQCHVYGQPLTVDRFEADHVKSHTSGGASVADNYLPACKTCNNYRWFYLAEEFQWILKLGVWARTEVEKNTRIGKMIGERFTKGEGRREDRRKNSRKQQ